MNTIGPINELKRYEQQQLAKAYRAIALKVTVMVLAGIAVLQLFGA